VDGESLGKTPIIQKALRVGKHTYEVNLANHYPITEEISIEREYKYDKKYELKPMESTVTVTSRPTGATIYINNELQGLATPAKFTLLPGTYLIGTWSKGYVQEEQKVVLEPNKVTDLNFVMKEGNVPQGMVLIPAGEFVWGADGRSPDESPRRKENLKAFYIDKYEVTNAQFKEVFPEHTFRKGLELHPVAGISWNQAIKYAQLVGKRLPTEAEWEKAARSTDGREYPWGDEFNASNCNSLESQLGATTRVGERLEGASAYGVMDMAGNVAEWTFDWYDRYPGNRDVAKDYGQVYRVVRGGGFTSEKFDVRCARRHFDKVDVSKPDYGLRCAKDVEEAK
jgi:formylglycine-generating enzyme required for sulfatase activity